MTILIDLTSLYYHLSGIERYAIQMTRQLLQNHGENQYILLFANEIHPQFRSFADRANIRMLVVPSRNRLVFSQLRLPIALYRERADLCFFPAFCAPWLFRHPCIIDTIHDVSDFECSEGKSRLKTLYAKLGIYHAKHSAREIVTVSQFSKRRIHAVLGIPQENIHVTYNGNSENNRDTTTPWEEIQEKYQLPDRYLLTVSTMEPRKNIRLLLDAFSDLQKEDPSLHLVLCGRMGWNLQEVFGTHKQSGGNIHSIGFAEDGDLWEIYRHAALFVFPSKYEGFGIPPVEAMARGCLVLSSDATAMPEVLGDAALYFKSGDLSSLRRAIKEALGLSAREKEHLREQGLRQAEKYRWETEAEKLYSVIMEARKK